MRRATVIAALLVTAITSGTPAAAERWIATWGFAPVAPSAPRPALSRPTATNGPAVVTNATLRQLMRVSAGGERVRIRFTNEHGEAPLIIGSATVALAGPDGTIRPGSVRPLRFDGRTGVKIPASAPMLSDAVDLKVGPLDTLAVSLFLPQETKLPAHRTPQYLALGGDHSGAAKMPGAVPQRIGALVSRVEVVPTAARQVIVAIGDSITEGTRETPEDRRNWPDRLAERLGPNWAVVNSGISGNRLLHDVSGENALARFDRDVLSVAGVTHVIVLEGINDIGRRIQPGYTGEGVSAEEMIAGYKQLIARAHARGLKIYGGTIMPFKGAGYYDAAGEAQRQAVNKWIRTSGAFDGVIDFDAAVRDPARPTRFRPDYHRGDYLHPNEAGYRAMGDAIDLKLFGAP